jgi:hypothetical protein
MKPAEKLAYLQNEVDQQVASFGGDAGRHKATALRLKIMSVILAALITVLLGLKLSNPDLKDVFSNVALVLGALITISSAYEAFFDPRTLWVRETVTSVRLKDLQRDLRFWTAGTDPNAIDAGTVDHFKSRLDGILRESLKNWIRLRGASDLEAVASAEATEQSHSTPNKRA